MDKTFFPEEFVSKYKQLLGSEWEAFFNCIKEKQPKSFWVNTNLTSVNEVMASLSLKKIKFENYSFSKNAFCIDYERPGQLEEFKGGKISLQEKAAMLPALALGASAMDKVLDACAAPGMKTIQLSNSLDNKGKIIACDVNSERIKSIEFNKKKYALRNVEVKRTDFRNVTGKFDKILLDAPCSSEGLVRKDREALKGWSQKLVERKAQNQKELILAAFDMLADNGELVYSTCSFAPEENEEVVNFLLNKRKRATVLPLQFDGIKTRKNDICKNCLRLYPQDNNTQQFFIAKIKKSNFL